MKAISIKQPWASLIADGVKTIEVRSWRTHYRGPLLIVSSAAPAGLTLPLPGGALLPLPAGRMLAVVDLIDCRPWLRADLDAACLQEYDTGLHGWHLANPRHVRPAPVRGRLNLYDVADSLIELLDQSDHHANHL